MNYSNIRPERRRRDPWGFLGGLLVAAGFLLAMFVYITTIGQLLNDGSDLLLLSLFPPADLVLAFMVDTHLGWLGVFGTALFFCGVALTELRDQ